MEKREVDSSARAGLTNMIQVIACHHDFDYSAFEDLPFDQKKDLVSYGLNGSKFKNISTPELGEIFTQELGL